MQELLERNAMNQKTQTGLTWYQAAWMETPQEKQLLRMNFVLAKKWVARNSARRRLLRWVERRREETEICSV